MSEDKGVERSSVSVDQPPAGSAVGARIVFLSYASGDAVVANQVCEFLESNGVSCWMAPRDVKPGAVYADAIVRAINEANLLVLVLSASAMASAHVGREVERAASKRKQIVAFRVDGAPLSPELEYFLSNSQWIDVTSLGMPGAVVKLAEAAGQRPATSSQPGPGLGSGEASGRSAIHHAVGAATVAKRVIVAAAIVVVIAIAGLLAVHFWTSKPGQPAVTAISDKSIAVLPFTDMSEKKDQEYFADGMAEEILDVLARIPGLHVIARTSSFQFKGKNEDIRNIGVALGAAHVVEGSVRRAGDRIRVTAQLIRSADGAHEWSGTYDRDVNDVLQVQQAIAVSLSRALEVTVEAGSLTSSGTSNPAAYDLFLRGLQSYDRVDKAGLEQAEDYFREALDLEPGFTQAEESLALTHLVQADNALVPAQEGWERVRVDAERLVKENSRSMTGHALLARIHTDYDWDWDGASREAAESLAANPRTALAHYAAGALENALGHWAEAESHLRAAISLDPLDPDPHQLLGTVLFGAGRFGDAAAEHRRALEIDPTFAFGHFELALDLMKLGQSGSALHEMELESYDGGKLCGLAMAYHALGRKADSDAALAQLTRDGASEKAYEIAEAHAFRGEVEEAFVWLERAYRQRDFELSFIKSELRINDARYDAFLRKMNFPE